MDRASGRREIGTFLISLSHGSAVKTLRSRRRALRSPGARRASALQKRNGDTPQFLSKWVGCYRARQARTTKRSCAPDAAHSPLALRAPGDRNARPRVHDPQLRSLVPADGECPQFAGWQGSQDPGGLPLGTPASLATLATGVHSKLGLTATLGAPAWVAWRRNAHGERRGPRRPARSSSWWFLSDARVSASSFER